MLAALSEGVLTRCQTVSGLEKSNQVSDWKYGGAYHALPIEALLVEEGGALVDALGGGVPPRVEGEVSMARPSLCATVPLPKNSLHAPPTPR